MRLLFLALFLALPAQAAEPPAPPAPEPKAPVAQREPKLSTIHGELRRDDYHWLRDKKRPAVMAYLKAENAYAAARMAPQAALQARLFAEMKARQAENEDSAPWRHGAWDYFQRHIAGQQYPLYCRRPAATATPAADAGASCPLDVNRLARGKRFMDVELFEPAPGDQLIAYTSDTTGYRQFRLHILDTRSGRELPFKPQRVTSLAWSANAKSLFFTTENATTKRSDRAWRLDLPSGRISPLYREGDTLYNLYFEAQRSGDWVLLTSQSFTSTEVRAYDAHRPSRPARLLLPRQKDIEYYVAHRGEEFWLLINDTGRSFRLVRAPQEAVSPARFTEVLPARAEVTLTQIEAFADHLLVAQRRAGLPQLSVIDADSGKESPIAMPEAVYEARLARHDDWQAKAVYFEFESFTTPKSLYAYDPASAKLALVHRSAAPNFEPGDYQSARIELPARDGSMIPVSLVWKRGSRERGAAPTLLAGYGAYGHAYPIQFRAPRASLLDRGMVFAVAHVRGGADLGKAWHDGGRMLNKKNTFTDFIDVAEGLIKTGVTQPTQLAITGGSAGGLLMGAVVNMRPELFSLVLSQVPFVDVINTMLDESIPLTTGEFVEWGNPKDPKYYAYMRSYSPYDNIAAKAYPTMLVKTGLNDSQVGYWEPAKYVAKLRATRSDAGELLFVTNLDAGHGGASGRYDQLHESAFDFAFVLSRLGLEQ